jgi:hypothetical protein
MFDRLTDNIREELNAQNALLALGLSTNRITDLANAIAINIDYAFEVRWSPRWEGTRRDQPPN